jgi:hypothetical protein
MVTAMATTKATTWVMVMVTRLVGNEEGKGKGGKEDGDDDGDSDGSSDKGDNGGSGGGSRRCRHHRHNYGDSNGRGHKQQSTKDPTSSCARWRRGRHARDVPRGGGGGGDDGMGGGSARATVEEAARAAAEEADDGRGGRHCAVYSFLVQLFFSPSPSPPLRLKAEAMVQPLSFLPQTL